MALRLTNWISLAISTGCSANLERFDEMKLVWTLPALTSFYTRAMEAKEIRWVEIAFEVAHVHSLSRFNFSSGPSKPILSSCTTNHQTVAWPSAVIIRSSWWKTATLIASPRSGSSKTTTRPSCANKSSCFQALPPWKLIRFVTKCVTWLWYEKKIFFE